MIIGNSVQGTPRDNINKLRGEKTDETQGNLGSHYRKDEITKQTASNLLAELDPDDRGVDYEDEKDWKDFYQ